MSARSSASRRMCWPSLARRVTTRVTAFFGSLLTVAPRERRRADRLGALRGFRLGMSAAVEHQGVGVLCFAAVDGVDGEQDDVAGAAGHIQHRGVLGDFGAALDEAGDE